MLQVILLILKIIGIILAVVLGLVILLIALVLFVPVRYRIRADYHGKPYADIRITWLLHLLNARLIYADGLKIKVRALVFNLYSSEADEKADSATAKSRKKEKTVFDDDIYESIEQKKEIQPSKIESVKNEPVRGESSENEPSEIELTEIESAKIESAEMGSNRSEPVKAQEAENATADSVENSDEDSNEKSIFEKIKEKAVSIKNKIFGIIRRICDTIKGIIHKSQEAKQRAVNKYNEIRDMINDPENREMVKFLLKQLKILWKKLKPKKYRVNIRYGFEDSETTGWIAVRAAVLYGLLGMDVNIIPDFDQSIFEGDIYMKGRITLFSLGVIALKVYRNKRFKKLVLER